MLISVTVYVIGSRNRHKTGVKNSFVEGVSELDSNRSALLTTNFPKNGRSRLDKEKDSDLLVARDTAYHIPKKLGFVPGVLSNCPPEMASLLGVISNLYFSVDQILRRGKYKIHAFNGRTWITEFDKTKSTLWKIDLNNPTSTVSSIRGQVDNHSASTQKNMSENFSLYLFPDGTPKQFLLGDSHEVALFHKNGKYSIEYSKKIIDQIVLEMRWDGAGNLISSNIYNWALRDHVISGNVPTNNLPHHRPPMNAAEAVGWPKSTE